MPDKESLLEVLLPKADGVRADDVEEFEHHGRHASEVARPRGSLERSGKSTGLDEAVEALRVHVRDAGRERDADLEWSEQAEIFFQVSRIARQVFAGTELRGVNEDGDDNHVARALGPAHQAQVPVVQRAHGWDQRERLALGVSLTREAFHFANGGDEPHV